MSLIKDLSELCNGLESRPVLKVKEKTKVWWVPSESVKGVTYEVIRNSAGCWYCDCPGFTFRGYCKHTATIEHCYDMGVEYRGER
jgi:hypothetical protein